MQTIKQTFGTVAGYLMSLCSTVLVSSSSSALCSNVRFKFRTTVNNSVAGDSASKPTDPSTALV